MRVRQLTMSDLCVIAGYSRDQMRGLLDSLPIYANRGGEARVASVFDAHDLLVVALCCRLEAHYCLKRQAVAAFSADMFKELSGPRSSVRGACLVLQFDPPSARYLEAVDEPLDGLIVPLESLFDQVDDYLLPGRANTRSKQGELALGPVSLTSEWKAALAAKARLPTVKSAMKG